MAAAPTAGGRRSQARAGTGPSASGAGDDGAVVSGDAGLNGVDVGVICRRLVWSGEIRCDTCLEKIMVSIGQTDKVGSRMDS